MVNTLRSDPQTSEEEHFKLMLVQTETERVKYLVRSYVRTRLHKVCHVSLSTNLAIPSLDLDMAGKRDSW
jgi:GINS complex subunit 4